MPETTATKPQDAAQQHPATIVGSTFMRQYYHFLAKEPASLHRFYKDESVWCHGVGSHMQEPLSGQQAINDEILRRGYAGARVDLDIGSIDCQASLNGGVFVLVTGAMTLATSPVPKPFVQTFFLAVQPKGYFVLNDCLRFLELPGASAAALSATDAAVAPKDVKKQPTHAAIGTPVAAASPAPKSKPVTPVAAAKKEKTPASPVAKPVETPVSPVKVKSPVKVASPKAAPAVAAAVAAPASPVKKAAPVEAKTTPKPSETKPATPASPAAAKPVATPASPAKPTPAAPVKPAEPVAPAAPPAPKTWAALFSAAPAAAPATPVAPVAAPKAVAKPAPASPAPAAAPKPADAKPVDAAVAAAAAPQEKEKKRYSSLYIRDIPPQTKESDLREMFKSYGSIANVTVPTGRGFAFVDYFEAESMRAALADTKEFKLYDKVIIVDVRSERKGDKDRSGPRTDSRGGRGGRGAPKSGRTGDRKEREDGKERRAEAPNGKAPASSSGPRSNANGERRDKGGRRSGKEEAGGRGAARAE